MMFSVRKIYFKYRTTLIPILLGNIVEWFEFSIYGYFAPIIGKIFIPSENQKIVLLSAFGIFAVGFIVRPLGGLFWGYIGDHYGRKSALIWSVVIMTIFTGGIALLPTPSSIGLAAPILLIFFRMMQGFSASGELANSMVFAAEHATKNKRGLYSSLTTMSACIGIFLGSVLGLLMFNLYESEALISYAWRIPFAVSALLGMIVYFIRSQIEETGIFLENVKEAIYEKPKALHFVSVLQINFLVTVLTVSFYMIFIYLPNYVKEYANIELSKGLEVNTISMLFLIILIPVFGWLSDIYGRKKILLFGSIGITIFSIPLFVVILKINSALYVVQFIFSIFIAACFGAIPSAISELAKTNYRCSIVSFGYNLSTSIFGGTSPIVAIYLIDKTDWIIAPGIYMALSGIITSVVLYFSHWEKNIDLTKL